MAALDPAGRIHTSHRCETVAYMAKSKAKGKGKSVKGARSHRPRPSTLSTAPQAPGDKSKAHARCAADGAIGQGTWVLRQAVGPWKGHGVRRTEYAGLSASESSDDDRLRGGFYASWTPVAYMGFLDSLGFYNSDEEGGWRQGRLARSALRRGDR